MATMTYFIGRGLAEQGRWMLAATNEPFSNKTFTSPDELDALRATGKLAMNQLPLLEIDGLNLVQSGAIVRYLARKHDLEGGTPAQKALADIVYESVRDFGGIAVSYPFETATEEGKAAYPAKLQARIDKYLPRFEQLIIDNPESDVYTVQATATHGDLALAEVLYAIKEITGSEAFLAPYPHVLELAKVVWSLPQIVAYLASDLRFPLPGAAYVANVDTVLRR